jgi:hypothetical protein
MKRIHKKLWLLAGISILLLLSCITPVLAARPTVLSVAADPTGIIAGEYTVISGKLSDASTGAGITGQAVTIQISDDGLTWQTAGLATTRIGQYSLNKVMTQPGDYYFRAVFSGSFTYSGAMSAPVLVQVTSPEGPEPTDLTLQATPAVLQVNELLSLNGRLTAGEDSQGLAGQPVIIKSSSDGITFNTLALVQSDSNGNITWSQVMYTPGRYYFRAEFSGTSQYTGSSSPVTQATVTSLPGANGTSVTIETSSSTPTAGTPFTISGILTDSGSGLGIGYQSLKLQVSTDGSTWNAAALMTTLPDGNYSVSQMQGTAGAYRYRTVYDGNNDFTGSTSPVTTVNVVAKTAKGTALTLNMTPVTIKTGEQVTATGKLTDSSGGRGLSGLAVMLQYSTDGMNWNTAGLGATRLGEYTIRHTPADAGNYTYRAVFSGSITYAPAESPGVAVMVNPLPQPEPTTLTLTVTPDTASIGGVITLNGTLSTQNGGTGLENRQVRLQSSTDGVNWNPGWLTTTFPNGYYIFLQSNINGGTFYYRAKYDGDATTLASMSPVIQVIVKRPTSVTASVSPVIVNAGQGVNITGTLTDSGLKVGIMLETVTVEQSTDTTNWTTAGTADTRLDGTYVLADIPPAVNPVYYRAHFMGSAYYEESISNSVGVFVRPLVVA